MEAMSDIPNFHDGFFDGFWLGDGGCVRLFVRTQAGERFTIVLSSVAAMKLSNVKAGNIMFDVVITPPEDVATADVGDVYDITRAMEVEQRRLQAHEKHLSLLTISSSYGADGLLLFATAEVVPNHILPSVNHR
jgi:hypothetical protein